MVFIILGVERKLNFLESRRQLNIPKHLFKVFYYVTRCIKKRKMDLPGTYQERP